MVAVLTVLILPAFTRQWDDRQKARELKAGLIEDMALTLIRSHQYDVAVIAKDSPDPPRSEDQLYANSARVAAKLAAYFSDELANRWENTVIELETMAELAKMAAAPPPSSTVAKDGWDTAILDSVYELLHQRPPKDVDLSSGSRTGELLAADLANPDGDHHAAALTILHVNIIKREEELANDVLVAAPKGFSTTRLDLFRDIVPGI